MGVSSKDHSLRGPCAIDSTSEDLPYEDPPRWPSNKFRRRLSTLGALLQIASKELKGQGRRFRVNCIAVDARCILTQHRQ